MNINLLDEAIKIPPKERVTLAEQILASIDYEDNNTNNAWVSEVKSRIKSVKEGKSNLLDFNQHYVDD